MKRIKQLRPLSMEHHLSLVLANKAIKTAREGDKAKIKTLCQHIAKEFEARWETHFATEEQLIFSLFNTNEQSQPTFSDATEAIALVELLKTQHTQMRLMSIALSTGHTDQLEAFGILLRDHTRLEERRLFPLISEIFTTEALDIIEKQTTIL